MTRFFLFLTLAFISSITVGQSFTEAVSLLHQNKRAEASNAFSTIPSTDNQFGDARLYLALLELDNGHADKAFEHFNQFFKQSSNPYPYTYALWNTGLFEGQELNGDPVFEFLKNLVNDSRANNTLRAMAADKVGGRLTRANKIAEAKKWYATISDVKNWASVGGFENVSASGFNKDFGVLQHPEPTHKFTNNRGAAVYWFNLPDARNDRWLDFEYHYDVTHSIIYGQTFLQSPEPQEVKLLLGVSGSFKIWVNDFLVASEMEERNTDLDVYQYKVQLNKGANRILIQIGSSDIERSNFMLRITDLNDQLLNNLQTTQQVQAYQKASPYEVQRFPLFAEKYFEEKTEKQHDFLHKLLLTRVYNHNDKRFEARKLAQQLKKAEPNSTMVSQILVEAYGRDNNTTDLKEEMEFVKTNDSLSLFGLMLAYNDAIEREDFETAQQKLEKREALYGSNLETRLKWLDLYSNRKEYERLLTELDIAYKDYPNSVAIVAMQYRATESRTKDLKKANEVLVKYLRNNQDDDITEAVIGNTIQLGRLNEGMNLYKKLMEEKPYATMRYTRIAAKYYEMKDFDNALAWQQKAIDRAPYVGAMLFTKAAMLEAAGKKDAAVEAYKRTVELAPNNYDARKKLRNLEGRKSLFDVFKQDDVYALFATAPKAIDYPNDNCVYILKDMQQLVYPENGASEEKNILLLKILNQSGLNEWKEVSLPYNEYSQRLIIDKAELIKKDGRRMPAETNGNQLVFSSLEIGDGLHISYRLETATSGKLAEHFWEQFYFNGGYPIVTARFSLLTPANRPFQYRMYNSKLTPVISQVEDFKLHVWERKNAEAVQGEPYMPPFADVAERVVITSIPDWNYVANWYSDLSNVKAKTDFEVKETVKDLFAGKKGLSDLEKAKTIYSFIEENFNYSDVPFLHSALTPQPASRTLRTRLGDCKDLSTLFVAMGKEAGIDANLVLVDTRNNGDMNLDLPTIGFNHCIAQFNSKGQNYLVELTDNYLPFGAMSQSLLNANGLQIPKEGASTNMARLTRLNTQNRPVNLVDRSSSLAFEGKTAIIKRNNIRIGAEASGTRYSFKDKSTTDRENDLRSTLSSEFNKKISLKSVELKGLENLSDSVHMDYAFTVENFSSELMGMQIFKLPWADAFQSLDFVSLEDRKYPFNLWSFSGTPLDRETITVEWPAGKQISEKPADIELKHPAIRYQLTYRFDKGKMIVNRQVDYLKEQVPVEEYDSFRQIITQIAEADNKQYGYK